MPNPAMHPGCRRELPLLTNPIERDQLLLKLFLGHIRLIRVGKFPDDLPFRVDDLDCHCICRRRQIVVEDSAVWRIRPGWFIRRERSVSIGVALNPISGRWCE